MAARTLALAAGGRARVAAAAAAVLGARLQPLAPPLGRRLPCSTSSLLSPRAPPLLGPRGPGASRFRPLAPMSFHPVAFSSTNTAKGVEDQDPDGGGAKRKETARDVDAGAKNGRKKPEDAFAAELPKKTHPGEGDDPTAGEFSKNQPPGNKGEKMKEEPACAIDAEAKKPESAAGAELTGKKTYPGDDPTADDFSKNQPPGDGGQKTKEEAARAIDAGAKSGTNKPDAAAADELSKKNNQPAGNVSEHAGNPSGTEECKGVTFQDKPTGELANKGHAGDDPTAGDLSLPPRTPATPSCPPTVESSPHSGDIPPPSNLSNLPALESFNNPATNEIVDAILKAIQAQSKENQKNVLKGVKELLEHNSNMERERSRVSRNNQTMVIILGMLFEFVIVGAAGIFFGIQLAVEKVRDQVHAMSGDDKTKEVMWNLFDTAWGYVGYKLASPVIFVGKAMGAGARKVGGFGKRIATALGFVRVEGVAEVVEDEFAGCMIWWP